MAAHLTAFGYDTLTLDEGWAYDSGRLLLDGNGLPRPNELLYPRGLPWLAAQLRARGVKLGLWVIRGVPRAAVAANLPIAGSRFTARDAFRADRNCSWSSDTYGVRAGAAADAYYASLAAALASYGASFVKIDCLWPHLYEGTPQTYFNDDVDASLRAFKAASPPLVVSLSPGISVSPQNGSYVAAGGLAAMYRIAEDVLDVYNSSAAGTFPQGVQQKLHKALEFEALLPRSGGGGGGGGGASPDFDMLQLGRVIHSYGAGALPPTPTRLTRDEQLTEVTLFCFTGVPLILGGRLPLDAGDAWTLALLTNAEVLAVHNASAARRSFAPPEAARGADAYGWAAAPAGGAPGAAYAAVFSAGAAAALVTVPFSALSELPPGTEAACVRDLWSGAVVEPAGAPLPGGGFGVALDVPAHGARAALVTAVGDARCRAGLRG